MHIDEMQEMANQLGFTYNIQTTGSPDWKRVFIVTLRGVTVGRINFFKDELHNVKCYKRSYHERIDDTDFIFLRIQQYLKDRSILSKDKFESLVSKAHKIREKELQELKDWRARNPAFDKHGNPKQRSKLKGRKVRNILNELVTNDGT